MNTKTLIAAALVSLLGANIASAQEAIPATWANEVTVQSSQAKSREQVKAELVAARANGELSTSSDNYGVVDHSQFASSRTRSQVVAEYKAARADGSLDVRGELYGLQGRDAPFVSTKTRAQVQAETVQAMAAGHGLSQGDRTGG